MRVRLDQSLSPLMTVVIATLVLGACSGGTSAAASPSPSPRAAATAFLSCDNQAYPGTPASSGLRVDGLMFDLLDKPVSQGSAVPVAANGTSYYLYKAFVYVNDAPNSRISFAVESPKTARLYYVDPTAWSSDHSPAGILSRATSQVTIEACPGLTGYTGGVLVQSPACVRLVVTAEGQVQGEADLRLGVTSC